MTKDEILTTVSERLGKFRDCPTGNGDLELGYDAVGADSMDMVVLAFELEELLGINIKPEIFMQHETVMGALEAIIHDYQNQHNSGTRPT